MMRSLSGGHWDVAIVGYGPTGAVAASLLGQAGVRVLVIDRAEDVYDKPRALALDHEIMRVFQQIGIIDEIRAYTEPFTSSEYFGADGRLIKRLGMVPPPYPLGYVPSLVFSQPMVEKVLREHVQSISCVDVALPYQCVALEQNTESVCLSLIDREGNDVRISADYVIGCDGASSTVRSQLDIGLEDLDFDEPWLVVDMLVNESGLAKLPASSVQYCEPERPCTYVIGPKNHRRWEISLLPHEDPALMATEVETWRLLKRWIGPEDAVLWRQAAYRFHALVAKEWNVGRTFIAGDAAHQQPPFLGQGMCQGIRDAVNLSWKLASVLKGEADVSLLETYANERGRHVRTLTGQIKAIGAVICERNRGRAEERDRQLLSQAQGEVFMQARQDIIPPLETGMLHSNGHSSIGTIFPQPQMKMLTGPALMDEIVGYGWRIISNVDIAAIPAAIRSLATRVGKLVCFGGSNVISLSPEKSEFSLSEVDGVVEKWFRQHDCIAVVVRPDHYVFGAVKALDDLPELLAGLPRAEALA